MSGVTDLTAPQVLNDLTGNRPYPATGSRWLGLFSTVPTSDAATGNGSTELSGGGYARVQVAGAVAATASFTTASPNITMTTNPGWVVPGMNVYDNTNGFQIGTVSTYVGTALVLTANAAHNSSGSTDSLIFSAWPGAGASSGVNPNIVPSSVVNGAAITFAASTGSQGTAIGWGIFDASSAGNLTFWEYLGNFAWIAASVSNASPGVFTSHAHGYSNGDTVVVSSEIAGFTPTTAGSFAGSLTVAGVATDTFNVGVNTTSTGDVLVRKVAALGITTAGITPSFAASTLTLVAA